MKTRSDFRMAPTRARHPLPSHALFRTSGFTLIEVLIAVAVFAIFSAMAYGGLMRLLDSRERVDAERVFWRETSLGFHRLKQDFSLARNRRIRDNDGTLKPDSAFKGQPTDPRAMGDPNVEFTRGGIFVPNGFTADLQRVAYRVVDGNLVRFTWPVLDRAPLTQPAGTPILRDVEEFEVRFYQNGAWIDRWPPIVTAGNAPPLPGAVEVTIALKERGKYKRVFLVGDDK
jgi:general secretion pathway protein J